MTQVRESRFRSFSVALCLFPLLTGWQDALGEVPVIGRNSLFSPGLTSEAPPGFEPGMVDLQAARHPARFICIARR